MFRQSCSLKKQTAFFITMTKRIHRATGGQFLILMRDQRSGGISYIWCCESESARGQGRVFVCFLYYTGRTIGNNETEIQTVFVLSAQ